MDGESDGVSVDHAAGLAAIARRLTLTHMDTLEGLRQHAGEDTAEAVRVELSAAAHRLTRGPLRIVFGGHFSSGKSTMINMLIGQPLLPVGDYPETGVPCVIATGAENSVRVAVDGTVRPMPFSTASIAASVSLIGNDGRHRPEIARNTQLWVTLAGGPIARNAVWIDSPGINDSPEMTERATAVADEADMLIWLVNTRQPLSEVEAQLLREYVERRGPAAVVFLVNAFLQHDSREQWEWFLAERAGFHRRRIDSTIDTGGLAKWIVFTSARGAAADPDSFGAPQARALLAELCAPTLHPRIAATRAFLARATLRRLSDDLGQRESAAAARLADERAAHEQAQAAARRWHETFIAAVRNDVRRILADNRPAADAAVAAVTARVNASVRAPGYWADQLRDGLTPIAETVVTRIVTAIATQASRHGQPAPPTSIHPEIAAMVAPPSTTVSAGALPGLGGGLAMGSAAGFAAGTIVPVIGHVVGTAAGAIIGGLRARSVRNQAVGELRSAVHDAGHAAVAAMFADEPIVQYVQNAWPAAAARRGPDGVLLASLRTARTRIATSTAELPEISVSDGRGDR